MFINIVELRIEIRWNVRGILVKLPEQEMSDQQYYRLAIGLSNIKIRKEYLLIHDFNPWPSQLGEAHGGASRRSSEKHIWLAAQSSVHSSASRYKNIYNT